MLVQSVAVLLNIGKLKSWHLCLPANSFHARWRLHGLLDTVPCYVHFQPFGTTTTPHTASPSPYLSPYWITSPTRLRATQALSDTGLRVMSPLALLLHQPFNLLVFLLPMTAPYHNSSTKVKPPMKGAGGLSVMGVYFRGESRDRILPPS